MKNVIKNIIIFAQILTDLHPSLLLNTISVKQYFKIIFSATSGKTLVVEMYH